MKKTISILSATRAEYGLLRSVIKKINESDIMQISLVVTGMHLSPEFGMTYKEIVDDGFKIDKKIEILLSSDTSVSVSKSLGLAMIGFSEYFEEVQPDMLLVLGDRFETFAVCAAATNAKIPIAHLYGGESTQGAVDECMRHSISKMSYLHFTSMNEYRKRVMQLGEDPSRVFNVGGLGIENITNTKLLSKHELENSIRFQLDMPLIVVTFHPVTLEENNVEKQFGEILDALNEMVDYKIIFTKANSDAHGRIINYMIDNYVNNNPRAVAFESLGMLRYLSVLSYCDIVIGNSSSGILEVPSFHIPTINIGDRQKGRLHPASVIDCRPDKNEIISAMDVAVSQSFKDLIYNMKNPYGDGNTSDKIVAVIEDFMKENRINLKKQFYDIMFEVDE